MSYRSSLFCPVSAENEVSLTQTQQSHPPLTCPTSPHLPFSSPSTSPVQPACLCTPPPHHVPSARNALAVGHMAPPPPSFSHCSKASPKGGEMPSFPIQNDTNFHQIPPTGATVPSIYPPLLEITASIHLFICLPIRL